MEAAAGKSSWAVVGGGMLGLTLAYRLAQRGKRVTLFEAQDRLGGLASAWQIGDLIWDRHYHVTLLSDSHLRALLTELDLETVLQWERCQTGCFANGDHHPLTNAVDFLRFPLLSPLDKLRLGATIFYGSRVKDGRRLERVAVADWLRRWSGPHAFEVFWRPLLRSKLGDAYNETSASFIWATIARLYAARQAGLKQEMFGYVPGGYARILSRFAEVAEVAGVSIRCGCPVEAMEGAEGRVRVRSGRGGEETFDRVVATMAAPVAARVCPTLTPKESDRLKSIRYLGIVCASVLLKNPLSGYYVTNLLEDGLPFTGVIEMSALVDREQFGGLSLVYLPKYLPSEDPYFSMTDEQVERDFLEGLKHLHPRFDRSEVVGFRVSRVRHVFALPTLGYSDDLPPRSTSVPGLHLVSSAHIVSSTLNVNETVRLADESVRAMLEDAA